jgi:hypothetical protein
MEHLYAIQRAPGATPMSLPSVVPSVWVPEPCWSVGSPQPEPVRSAQLPKWSGGPEGL